VVETRLTELQYQGYYINLGEHIERDQSLREHLQSLKLSDQYMRFDAIRGADVAATANSPLNPGSIGCGLSHLQLLSSHRHDGVHLHVLEDDAVLHPLLPSWFSAVPETLPWDLLYTDVYFSMLSPQTFQQLNRLVQAYQTRGTVVLVNLRGVPFVGTTSYFANRDSIGKVADLIGTSWISRCKHDDHMNQLVQSGRLLAYVAIPFLTTRSTLSCRSTIDSEYTSLMQAMDLQRAALFADANLEELADKAKQLSLHGPVNSLVTIYAETTRSILKHIDLGVHRKPD
jgi:hypothetical protein